MNNCYAIYKNNEWSIEIGSPSEEQEEEYYCKSFKTFTSAKSFVLKSMRADIEELKFEVSRMVKLRKSDLVKWGLCDD